jgi:hypothetical protein
LSGPFDGGAQYFVFLTLEMVRRVAKSQAHVDSTVARPAACLIGLETLLTRTRKDFTCIKVLCTRWPRFLRTEELKDVVGSNVRRRFFVWMEK